MSDAAKQQRKLVNILVLSIGYGDVGFAAAYKTSEIGRVPFWICPCTVIFIKSARTSQSQPTNPVLLATGLVTLANECMLYAASLNACNFYSFQYQEPFLVKEGVTIGVHVNEWFERKLIHLE